MFMLVLVLVLIVSALATTVPPVSLLFLQLRFPLPFTRFYAELAKRQIVLISVCTSDFSSLLRQLRDLLFRDHSQDNHIVVSLFEAFIGLF